MKFLSPRNVAWRLFLTCWLVYALHFATNTVREIYPALSLGDQLSFDVSPYLGLHPDIFAIPGRGAFINNNPGASILGAIPYILARPVIDRIVAEVEAFRKSTGQPPPEYNTIYPLARQFYQEAYKRGLDVKFGLAAGVMAVLLMAPLSALSVVVMFFVLLALTGSQKSALWLAILYGFATPVFFRTAQLNHNLLQSQFAFFAFVLLWRPWEKPAKSQPLAYFLAGAFAGWTLVLDYSGLIVIFFITLYAILHRNRIPSKARSKTDLPLFAAGVTLSTAVLIAYQWLAFGHPFYPAQHYMPATQWSVYGYQGMTLPQLDLLWENAFGIRYGLFLSAPLLILALYFPAWFRKEAPPGKSKRLLGDLETWFILLYTLSFFLFTAANQFSRMQFNSGVRHVIPVVPFLFFLAADVLLMMPNWLAIGIGVFSTYWSWCLAMYRDVEQGWGIFESLIHITTGGLRLPWLAILKNLGFLPGWVSAWLLLVLTALLIWIIWSFPPSGNQNHSQNTEKMASG